MSLWLTFSTREAEPYNLTYCDLEDAIWAEAETLAADAGSDEIDDPSDETRDAYAASIRREAEVRLREAGDSYTDPTKVIWRLVERED
jgi:hypothetical protein